MLLAKIFAGLALAGLCVFLLQGLVLDAIEMLEDNERDAQMGGVRDE